MELKIIDIIHHRNKYYVQQFIVVNRRPVYLYERKGKWLIAEDGGFFSFYYLKQPNGSRDFQAFGGRKFQIPLKNGDVVEARGQWWDGMPEDYSGLVSQSGYGVPEKLATCNVFCGGYIDKELIDKWLFRNDTSNNCNKYDKRHTDFGKQTIKSKWKGGDSYGE
jgi:hypothetical protein